MKKKLFLFTLILLLVAIPSFAQWNPNSPGAWDTWQQLLNKGLFLPASTTDHAPLRIPPGTAPTSPVNGDIWSTTAGFYLRVQGATIGPLGGAGGSVTPGGSAGDIQTNVAGTSLGGITPGTGVATALAIPVNTTGGFATYTGYSPPLAVGLARGTELMSAFAASPAYTVVSHVSAGSGFTEGAGTMTLNGTTNGVNTFVLTATPTIAAGTTYIVKATFDSVTTPGTGFKATVGGVDSTTITPAVGTFVWIITASTTAAPIFTQTVNEAVNYRLTSTSVKSVPNIEFITYTNTGLTATSFVYLPTVATGRTFIAYEEVAYAINVYTTGSNKMRPVSTDYTLGVMAASEATYMVLQGMGTTNRWRVTGPNASLTWTP
jgi:hypothetical protein